jgi:lipopolysaccharide transport system permease protein
VVEGFRWALVGGPAPGPIVLVSATAVAALLVGGLMFFRRSESTFADVI